MKNLDELLEQLKSEPEWTYNYSHGYWGIFCDIKIINGKKFSGALIAIAMTETSARDACYWHNATRARLLACVEALEMALKIATLMPNAAYERITDKFKIDELPNEMQADYDTAEQDIIAKLAAALETK